MVHEAFSRTAAQHQDLFVRGLVVLVVAFFCALMGWLVYA